MSIDLSTTLSTANAKITLPNPIVGASGSFGHSDELFDIVDPEKVGAITIKSLAPFISQGNVSPRVAATSDGMMNSVGLPGPHIQEWVDTDLKKLRDTSGRFIMAIWGLNPEDYTTAAAILAAHVGDFVAIEINLSCPNVHSGHLFAQNTKDTTDVVSRVKKELGDSIPISTKLSPNVTSVPEIAQAAIDAGSDMLTLFNTVMGLKVNPYTRSPILGKGMGGYSGSGINPIVQRGVYETHTAFPDVPIIGTGGVMTGQDAAAMMMCGASAVGVATATFADPRATIRITKELEEFCFETGVANVVDLIGAIEMQ